MCYSNTNLARGVQKIIIKEKINMELNNIALTSKENVEMMMLSYLIKHPTDYPQLNEEFFSKSEHKTLLRHVRNFIDPITRDALLTLMPNQKEKIDFILKLDCNEPKKFVELLSKFSLLRKVPQEYLTDFLVEEENAIGEKVVYFSKWYETASGEELKDYLKQKELDKNKSIICTSNIKFCYPEELPNAHIQNEWLIDNMLKQNVFSELVAVQKCGKTQMAMELAACVQNGLPFLGHNTIKKDVLYIDWETDECEILDRSKKLENFIKKNYKVDDYEQYKLISLSCEPNTKLEYILEAIRVEREKNENIGLIIFDNFYSLALDIDANALNEVVARLKEIKNGCGPNVATLLVNHTNKEQSRSSTNPTFSSIMTSAFGSNAHGMFTNELIYIRKMEDGVEVWVAGRHVSDVYSIPCVQDKESFFFSPVDVVVGKIEEKDFKMVDNYLNSVGSGISKKGKKSWSSFKSKFGSRFPRAVLEEAGYVFTNENKNIYISVREV